METELIRVMSDHGIIVLGYAGTDLDIQKIFEGRRSNLYPLFWVDPNQPKGQIEEILKRGDYTYIHCKSAAKFIQDYIELLGRLESIAPTTGISPTIPDVRRALATSEEPVVPVFSEFLVTYFLIFKPAVRISHSFQIMMRQSWIKSVEVFPYHNALLMLPS